MRNEERAAKRMNGTETAGEAILELPEAQKKDFKFKSVFTADAFKEGAKKFGVRNIAIVLSVFIIGAAVFVNWKLFGGPTDIAVGDGTQAGSIGTSDGDVSAGASDDVNYFEASLVERERARDEALEVLQGVVDDADSLEAAKEQALLDIATMAKVIENESNIETLIKAKGFEDCVAVINGEKASIIVKSEGLQPNDLSQILEIVYLQAGILPENVTIMEK